MHGVGLSAAIVQYVWAACGVGRADMILCVLCGWLYEVCAAMQILQARAPVCGKCGFWDQESHLTFCVVYMLFSSGLFFVFPFWGVTDWCVCLCVWRERWVA